MNSLTLTLPELPPSINQAYANSPNSKGRGRFKTGKYKAWEKLCLYVAKRPKSPMTGDLMVCYTFTRPDERRRDVANLEKVLSDFLVKAGIIEDDSQIVDLRLRWATEPMAEPVLIEIKGGKHENDSGA